MIISNIKTTLLSVPYEAPPQISFVSMENIDLLIIEIETSSGLTGMGYLHPIAGGMQTIEMCIHEMLKPLLIGKNAENVENLWSARIPISLEGTIHPIEIIREQTSVGGRIIAISVEENDEVKKKSITSFAQKRYSKTTIGTSSTPTKNKSK